MQTHKTTPQLMKRLKCNSCKKGKLFKLFIRQDARGVVFVTICAKCGAEILSSRPPTTLPLPIKKGVPVNVIRKPTIEELKASEEEALAKEEKVLRTMEE